MSEGLNHQPELDDMDTELQESIDQALLAGLSHQPEPKVVPVAVDLSRVYASLDAIQSEGWQRKEAGVALADSIEALRREIVASTDAVTSSIKSQMQPITVQLSKQGRSPSGTYKLLIAGAAIVVLSVALSSAAFAWWSRDSTTEKLARLGAALHTDVAQGKIPRVSVAATYKRLGLKLP